MFYFFLFHPIIFNTNKTEIDSFESYRQYKKRTHRSQRVSHREFLRIISDDKQGISKLHKFVSL